MSVAMINRRVVRLSLACLIALLALLAVVALAMWHGTGSPAEAGVVEPVVQVTPEDSHFYERATLVETASGTLVVVYSRLLKNPQARSGLSSGQRKALLA